MTKTSTAREMTLSEERIRERMLEDFRLVCISREASLLGRKEVLTGKAKFGIFGDGKELAQIAMARQFKNGDWRSGYYRDQTFMLAIGELNVRQYFAALYAHTDVKAEPSSAGRQMGGHYSTRFIDDKGHWMKVSEMKNSSADISPTAGQMPRLLGLAQASAYFKKNEALHSWTNFTNQGNEVAFGTIGDSSTSEGLFWETMNAACVMQVPMCMSVWDNGWGISVPIRYQTAKESISQALSGMESTGTMKGLKIFKVKGWNYPELMMTYEKAVSYCREHHAPVLVHVHELTQPQGHSTSGSHERYKSKELLKWYEEYDCIEQMKKFIVLEGAATEKELDDIREESRLYVRAEQKSAWSEFREDIDRDVKSAVSVLQSVAATSSHGSQLQELAGALSKEKEAIRKDIFGSVRMALRITAGEPGRVADPLRNWLKEQNDSMYDRYSSFLYSNDDRSALHVPEVAPEYDSNAPLVDGRIVLRDNWNEVLERRPEVLIFGEDVGKIGGVNQTYEGLQEKFGELRISDTGIREATIVGQAIGMSMRGLRPVAEIQYLDYLFYALEIMRDDLASVLYRTKGGQKAPAIISTRGHRLEGIWHSGSPMGSIIHSVRGMYVCVPRDMTQAAGMYNTLLAADDPAIVIECLNGYRSKERMPSNLGEFKIPLGIPEVLRTGEDLTMISYGSTLNICSQVCDQLAEVGIEVELIDIRTLLPFDIKHVCAASISKTGRVLIVDEDVPGGAAAYILDELLNRQHIFRHLDSDPRTLTAKAHLPAYGTDGDYFSKPSAEDIFEAAYSIMHEVSPERFASLF